MAVLTLALLEYGCSGDNDFMVVRGEVSYQGAPIEDGDIKFVHAPGTQTPTRSEMIKQGKYEASGRGALLAGTYRIEIRAYTGGLRRRAADRSLYDANVNLNSDTPKPEPREQVQPDSYNRDTELELFSVPAGSGSITRNFQLE